MIQVLSAIAAIFLILLFTEYLQRHKWLTGEANRKFIHISVASFVASWPFFMSFQMIELISIAFLAVLILSKKSDFFRSFLSIILHTKKSDLLRSINGLDRQGWGEAMFAVGIGLTALISANKWIFAAAMLHLGLADGLAALIGSRAAKKNYYLVCGEKRTLQGTLTFFILSFAITAWVVLIAPAGLSPLPTTIIGVPIMATVLENISVLGSDNIVVPVFIAAVLGII